MTASYHTPEVARITGIPLRTLDYWARAAILKPSLAEATGTGSERLYAPAVPFVAPVVAAVLISSRKESPPGPIPANVATREILQFIEADPNTKNWSDQAKQDLCSTWIIGFLKSKHIGLWERAQ